MNIQTNQMEIQAGKPSRYPIGWLLVGTFTLLAPILGTLFRGSFTWERAGTWLLSSAGIFAFFIPVLAFATWRGNPSGWQDIGLALGIWFMSVSCAFLVGRPPIFSSLYWNWTGKGFDILASLAFVALWRGITWRETGFAGLRKGSWLLVIVFLFLCSLMSVAQGTERLTNLETVLFQLTMPGIEEEIVFRGILLALLNRAFGTPWKMLGANIGWGLILSSVLFGLGHGVYFTGSQFEFSIPPIFLTGGFGFVLGWIRARTDSLYPAMVLHNAANGVAYFLDALIHGLA